jgi:hypothetical protein
MEELQQEQTSEATIQEVKVDALDTPEVNKAARDFGDLTPQIRAYAKNMKAGGLARVMIAAAEFPLGESYPKFKNKQENELFMMLLHVEGLKSVMKNAILNSEGALADIQNQAIDEVVEETIAKIAEEK